MEEENKIFLKLYKDSQRRNYLKENINIFDSFLKNPELPPKKVNKTEWNKIYTERFQAFQNKQKEKIEKRIIQEETKRKEQEDQIIEERNDRVLKADKMKIDSIFERIWTQIKTKQNSNQMQQEDKKDFKNKEKSKIKGNKGKDLNRVSLVERQKHNGNSILQKKLFLVSCKANVDKKKQKKTKMQNKPLTANMVEESQKRIHYFDNFLEKKY